MGYSRGVAKSLMRMSTHAHTHTHTVCVHTHTLNTFTDLTLQG